MGSCDHFSEKKKKFKDIVIGDDKFALASN